MSIRFLKRGEQRPYKAHVTAFSWSGVILETLCGTFSSANKRSAPSMWALEE